MLEPVPLLETGCVFEVFKVMNLPIPYLDVKQRLEIVAQYKIVSENSAFNPAKTEFMLLTQQDVRKI